MYVHTSYVYPFITLFKQTSNTQCCTTGIYHVQVCMHTQTYTYTYVDIPHKDCLWEILETYCQANMKRKKTM